MMIDLPTYNEANWNFVARGENSTNPSISDEGILTPGIHTYHIYKKEPLDKTKKYTIYQYNPRDTFGSYIGFTRDLTSGTPYSNLATSSIYGGITGINKITLYYDNTESIWKLRINEQTNNTANSTDDVYLEIATPNHQYSSDIKILAITEEDAD